MRPVDWLATVGGVPEARVRSLLVPTILLAALGSAGALAPGTLPFIASLGVVQALLALSVGMLFNRGWPPVAVPAGVLGHLRLGGAVAERQRPPSVPVDGAGRRARRGSGRSPGRRPRPTLAGGQPGRRDAGVRHRHRRGLLPAQLPRGPGRTSSGRCGPWGSAPTGCTSCLASCSWWPPAWAWSGWDGPGWVTCCVRSGTVNGPRRPPACRCPGSSCQRSSSACSSPGWPAACTPAATRARWTSGPSPPCCRWRWWRQR